MWAAIAVAAGFAVTFGLLLGLAAQIFRVKDNPLVEQLDSVLPQTQCGQCGYPGCRPYAEAMAKGEADVNRCPPGGEQTIIKLADILNVEPKPLDDDLEEQTIKKVAIIDEQTCIGCTKCIQACPVDAILGAAKQMHTVIEDECTGCELCVEPCPVDCIDMVPVDEGIEGYRYPLPESAHPKHTRGLARELEIKNHA